MDKKPLLTSFSTVDATKMVESTPATTFTFPASHTALTRAILKLLSPKLAELAHFFNRSETLVKYIIAGSKGAGDVRPSYS
jgi:hypothetical protein